MEGAHFGGDTCLTGRKEQYMHVNICTMYLHIYRVAMQCDTWYPAVFQIGLPDYG